MKYLVVQITETGEEFKVREFYSDAGACEWITENEDNFPESKFYIENIPDFRTLRGAHDAI